RSMCVVFQSRRPTSTRKRMTLSRGSSLKQTDIPCSDSSARPRTWRESWPPPRNRVTIRGVLIAEALAECRLLVQKHPHRGCKPEGTRPEQQDRAPEDERLASN